MKTKKIKAALLAVVVAVAGYGAYEAQCEEMQLSETMLANVEALADDENEVIITCSRSCSDGIGKCYQVYDEYGNCHFVGIQIYSCTC